MALNQGRQKGAGSRKIVEGMTEAGVEAACRNMRITVFRMSKETFHLSRSRTLSRHSSAVLMPLMLLRRRDEQVLPRHGWCP